MKTIDEIIDDIIQREGGYNDIKEDKGGATNFGISLRYASGIGLDLDNDGDVDKDDIRIVSIEKAKELYKDDFLYRPKIHLLPLELHPQLFDCSINHGPSQAIRFMQLVCVGAEFFPEFDHKGRPNADGVIGPATRKAAEQALKEMGPYFHNAIMEERIAFYNRIVQRDSSQSKFLKGWLKRAKEFEVAT